MATGACRFSSNARQTSAAAPEPSGSSRRLAAGDRRGARDVAHARGDVTGAACVALVAKQHVWNWPLGLLNNVFWALLFWRAKLYSDSSLQGIFFAIGCYGWWRWQTKGTLGRELVVRRTRGVEWKILAALVVVVTSGLAGWLAHATDMASSAAGVVLSLSAVVNGTMLPLESRMVGSTSPFSLTSKSARSRNL